MLYFTGVPRRRLTPPVDIYETDKEVIVVADMPGASKDCISINVVNNRLTISGYCQTNWEGTKLVSECPHLDYYRTFKLSEAIDAENIQAKIADGVLTLTLLKKQPAGPYRIPIEIE